jgi:PiT family inorganic phosphate transporter
MVVAVVIFAWTNGFHDASDSVATALATGALTPRVALTLTSVLSVIGGLFGLSVAQTLHIGLIEVPIARPGLGLVCAALLAAIVWNLGTWWFGMPSSSSHALLGGMVGAGLVAGAGIDWWLVQQSILLPMLVSPVLGFFAAWLFSRLLMRATQGSAHGITSRRFRMGQTVSTSAMALVHGLQDAQRSAGTVVIALVATGHLTGEAASVPVWAGLLITAAIGGGAAFGGRRIIRTLGRGITPLHPVTGFAAETVAAGALFVASGPFAVPVSSTHVVVASIMGGGATGGLRAIRWRVIRRIAVVLLLTPMVTAGLAAVTYQLAD